MVGFGTHIRKEKGLAAGIAGEFSKKKISVSLVRLTCLGFHSDRTGVDFVSWTYFSAIFSNKHSVVATGRKRAAF